MRWRYRPWSWLPLVALLLVAALIGGTQRWTESAQAQETTSQGTVSAQAALGTAFTYQGRLTDGGKSANGTYDFRFRLFDAASGGSQVGSTVTRSGVRVAEGLFTVELDFGDVFDGRALWLEVGVKKATESSYTVLGRQKLTATPYALSALSVRPGTTVQGALSSGRLLGAVNTATSGDAAALYGEVTAAGGAGVAGWNTGNQGGYGVYGRNTASSGKPIGVYGQAEAFAGIGVYGTGPYAGVYGRGEGRAQFPTYGVYGENASPNGYGIYSKGDAHIEGTLTWEPITGFVSIPAAAFRPYQGGGNFTNSGHTLEPDDAQTRLFLAPVYLPHEATVTKMTFYWSDGSDESNAKATLYRIDLAGSEELMAYTESSGGFSSSTSSQVATSSTSTTTIDYPTVDNSQYAYYVWLVLDVDGDGGKTKAHGVVIEYTIDRPH